MTVSTSSGSNLYQASSFDAESGTQHDVSIASLRAALARFSRLDVDRYRRYLTEDLRNTLQAVFAEHGDAKVFESVITNVIKQMQSGILLDKEQQRSISQVSLTFFNKLIVFKEQLDREKLRMSIRQRCAKVAQQSLSACRGLLKSCASAASRSPWLLLCSIQQLNQHAQRALTYSQHRPQLQTYGASHHSSDLMVDADLQSTVDPGLQVNYTPLLYGAAIVASIGIYYSYQCLRKTNAITKKMNTIKANNPGLSPELQRFLTEVAAKGVMLRELWNQQDPYNVNETEIEKHHCEIVFEVPNIPVKLNGHHYDLEVILETLKRRPNTCPFTNVKIKVSDIEPDRKAYDALAKYLDDPLLKPDTTDVKLEIESKESTVKLRIH